MTASKRLARLSSRVTAALGPAADPGPVTDEAWLAAFERAVADGVAAAEPDFPRAVTEYRAAVAAARVAAAATPGPGRPADAAVAAGWAWAAEISLRAGDGVPPVSEAEFAALAGWFGGAADRLAAAAGPGQALDLGGGDRVAVADLRWGVTRGARAGRAGVVADRLRRAKQTYG